MFHVNHGVVRLWQIHHSRERLMIEINGAHGEGGGQILRSSLSLAALTNQPLHIHHIRANRSKPGLRPQHLAAVQAVADLTTARVEGAHRDSQELTLIPNAIRSGRFAFDIHTAGSLSLVVQTVFLPLSFAEGTSRVTLTGGTHVRWSPVYHYLEQHWMPMMTDLGYRARVALRQAGFYPGGGGEVRLTVLPHGSLQPYACTEQGNLLRIRGLSGAANLPDHIAKRQKHQALKRLYSLCQDAKINIIQMPAPGKGTFVLLRGEFDNASRACFIALGAPGKRAEKVADEAVDALVAFLNTDGCVDQYLADQLLLPLALIEKPSRFRTSKITRHLLTNAHVIQQFLPVEIRIAGELDQPGLVSLSGK
jgi:RNA 3'-terminal phosphate cyclase (ATP)